MTDLGQQEDNNAESCIDLDAKCLIRTILSLARSRPQSTYFALFIDKTVHRIELDELITRLIVHRIEFGELITRLAVHDIESCELITRLAVHDIEFGELITRLAVHNIEFGELITQ